MLADDDRRVTASRHQVGHHILRGHLIKSGCQPPRSSGWSMPLAGFPRSDAP